MESCLVSSVASARFTIVDISSPVREGRLRDGIAGGRGVAGGALSGWGGAERRGLTGVQSTCCGRALLGAGVGVGVEPRGRRGKTAAQPQSWGGAGVRARGRLGCGELMMVPLEEALRGVVLEVSSERAQSNSGSSR